jgi:tungstate transport system substrate-binding protein
MLKKALFFLITLAVSITFVTAGETRITMATTTSTDNSGLLDNLLPEFTRDTGIIVNVVAVGTGKALKLGENGDVDVVLVHARSLEDRFVADGHGVNRRDVMYNDFVIVGPKDNPAKVKTRKSAAAAFKSIAKKKAVFISRGDNSGTHVKELETWKNAGIIPSGSWYREAGMGMGDVLNMAYNLQAYTLADRGTYLAYRDKIDLVILAQGDPLLFNPYGIIAVNPEKHLPRKS